MTVGQRGVGDAEGVLDGVEACAEVVPGIVRCDAALSHVFAILGKRWNGIIVGALSYGAASFSQLARGVTGISDSVLSERLSGLAAAGIVTRVVDSGPPVSVTYALSPAGQALVPALDELRLWAEQHLTVV
ncbi:MAG TPA: helix-turn-helix domain-containing protein [Friedmanniella sp.]